MVADIMKSLTIYEVEFTDEQKVIPKLVCRDPRGQWCFDVMPINNSNFLISDFKMNLVMLSRNTQNDK